MERLNYRYNCTSPKSLSELEYIIEHERQITYKTFRSKIDTEDFNYIKSMLGYDNSPIKLKDDWAVSYHKSKLPNGEPVYYLQHSMIEYIFY